MNKIKLFKINCAISVLFVLVFLLSSTISYASGTISINGNAIEQKIKEKAVTINMKNQPIKEILYEIQKQSGISFALNESEYAEELSKMSLEVSKMTIDNALDKLLEHTNFTYKVVGNSVTIVKRAPTQQAKRFNLKGKVIDGSTKRPIAGATVIVLGTSIGHITDDSGAYSVNITVGESIEVSFVGMKQIVKKIESEVKELNIVMELDQMNIDNVVVTGYGNINKNSFTGNATTIKGEDLMKVSRTNVIKALQSFDPSFRLGDDIQFGSDPNALPDVYIRGRSSLGTLGLDKDKLTKNSLERNPNTPTFIMDGFEVSLQKVYDLDPNRIQTMTILKDAAATAMYGSRAANGVIVITTVPPKEGEVRVSYNLTATLELPDLSDYSLMNAREKMEAERLSGLYDYDPKHPYSNYIDYLNRYNAVFIEGVETDWMALPLRNAFKHKHSATVEGGTKSIRYIFDAGYEGDNGVMKGSERNTGSVGLNLNMTFGKMTVKNYVSFTNITSADSPYGRFSDFSHQQPYAKFQDEDGNYPQYLKLSGQDKPNPMREATLDNFTKSRQNELLDNLQVRWNFNEYLFAEGQFGILQSWDDNTRFVDPKSLNSTVKLGLQNVLAGDLYTTMGESGRLNGKFLLSYNRSIDKHNVNFSFNAEMSETTGNSIYTHYRGFPSGKLSSVNYATEVNGKPQKTDRKSRTAGVSGVFNYSFDNIYLFDLSLRYEGSSAFGTEEKAAPYWAGGFGVNVHNYKFMQGAEWLNIFKVRVSYGQIGNVNFPAYAAQSYYDTMFDDWYVTGYGTKIKYLGNPDLKAEKTNTVDLGFNATMFNNRLDVKFSYYNKTTHDMINDVTIPTSSGFNVYKNNLGKVRNVGFEAILSGTVIDKKDFNLAVNVNYARNKNTMLEIGQSLKDYNDRVNYYYDSEEDKDIDNNRSAIWTKYEEGRSMTALYGMKSLGIDPATGQEVYVNRAGGIVHKWDTREMVDIGDTEPKGQGSLGLNARYKQITLSASLQYEFGGYYYNSTLINYVENAKIATENVDKRVLTQRWQKPGDISPLKDIKDRSETTRPTSRFMQKNNFLSLNSISLQYEFGEAVTKTLHIERLRLEANCSEVFRFSTIKQERGLDYPFARSFGLTLMVNF